MIVHESSNMIVYENGDDDGGSYCFICFLLHTYFFFFSLFCMQSLDFYICPHHTTRSLTYSLYLVSPHPSLSARICYSRLLPRWPIEMGIEARGEPHWTSRDTQEQLGELRSRSWKRSQKVIRSQRANQCGVRY